jgi:EF-hand domain pair
MILIPAALQQFHSLLCSSTSENNCMSNQPYVCLHHIIRCMQEELRILNAQDKVRRDSFTAAHGGYQATPLHEHDTDSSAMKRLKSLLKPFYDKYDVNGNGTLDVEELHAVFKDLNEDVRQKDLAHLFEEFDTDKDQLIDFDEFVLGVAKVCVNLHCLCL